MNALRQARELGCCLVVGINGDEAVLAAKGFLPVYSAAERAEVIASCKWVDEVVVGTPYAVSTHLLDALSCEFAAHGDDWVCSSTGEDAYAGPRAAGRMKTFARTEGVSSTAITKKLLHATAHLPLSPPPAAPAAPADAADAADVAASYEGAACDAAAAAASGAAVATSGGTDAAAETAAAAAAAVTSRQQQQQTAVQQFFSSSQATQINAAHTPQLLQQHDAAAATEETETAASEAASAEETAAAAAAAVAAPATGASAASTSSSASAAAAAAAAAGGQTAEDPTAAAHASQPSRSTNLFLSSKRLLQFIGTPKKPKKGDRIVYVDGSFDVLHG